MKYDDFTSTIHAAATSHFHKNSKEEDRCFCLNERAGHRRRRIHAHDCVRNSFKPANSHGNQKRRPNSFDSIPTVQEILFQKHFVLSNMMGNMGEMNAFHVYEVVSFDYT